MISDKQLDELVARANPMLPVPHLSENERISIIDRIVSGYRTEKSPLDDLIRLHASVSLSVQDRVGILEIDDGKANVLTLGVIQAINNAIQLCEIDSEVTTIVIAGRPGILSAGLDRNLFLGDHTGISETLNALGYLIVRLYGSKLRIVTACTGHAIAAGALLLLASDVRIGKSGSYKLGMNEAAIGVALPEWAIKLANHRLPKPAFQLTMATGHLYQVAEAINAGLLDKTTDNNVSQEALDEAKLLSALDLEVYAETALMAREKCLFEMRKYITPTRSEGND